MQERRLGEDERICLNLSICARDKKELLKYINWLYNKLMDVESPSAYHIVGDIDTKTMLMHNQMIGPAESVNFETMARRIPIPKEVYEKLVTDYHFKKTMDAFNDAIDDEFKDD